MRTPDSREDEELASEGALNRVQAYQLAVGMAHAAVEDGRRIAVDEVLRAVSPQLVRAVASIAANIAEGYPRRSRADRVRYYEYALGSTLEGRRWYSVTKSVLPADVLGTRMSTLASIRRLLMAMIRNDRAGKTWGTPGRRKT